MMTPACPRLLDMINDFVVLRFWARAPRGFKRYRSYIILLLLLNSEYFVNGECVVNGEYFVNGDYFVNGEYFVNC